MGRKIGLRKHGTYHVSGEAAKHGLIPYEVHNLYTCISRPNATYIMYPTLARDYVPALWHRTDRGKMGHLIRRSLGWRARQEILCFNPIQEFVYHYCVFFFLLKRTRPP